MLEQAHRHEFTEAIWASHRPRGIGPQPALALPLMLVEGDRTLMNVSDVTTTQWIIGGALLVAIVLAVVAIFAQRRNWRTTKLQTKFGDAEYARALEQGGSKKLAEAGLDGRTQRVEALNIRALSSADRARFEESWRQIQARFVDGPSGAVTDAELEL